MGSTPALAAIKKIWFNLQENLFVDEMAVVEFEKIKFAEEYELFVAGRGLSEKKRIKVIYAFFLLLLGLFHSIISLQDAELAERSFTAGFKRTARLMIHKYNLELFFDPRLLDHITEEKDPEIALLMTEVSRLLEKHGFDPFGLFFQDLLSSHMRKRYAVNYTVSFVLGLLTGLSIDSSTGKVMDPFAGSGKLLAAVIKQESTLKKSDPDTVLQRLYGIDIFKPAVLLAICQLAFTCHEHGIQVPKEYYRNPRIYHGDSFRLLQPKDSKKLDSYYIEHDSTLDIPERFDLVIQNPPYSRYTNLPKKYTDYLKKRFSKYQIYLKHQLGLHGFALILSDEILAEKGRIAAVLPASTFYSNYGTGLKQLLLHKYCIEFVITSKLVKAFSEGSDFREIILIGKKTTESSRIEHDVKFVSLNKHPNDTELFDVVRSLKEAAFDGENEFFSVKCVNQAELNPSRNWMVNFFPGDHEKLVTDLSRKVEFKPGNKMEFQLFRGFEMYGPDFFFLPNKYWAIRQISTSEIVIQEQDSGKLGRTICKIPREYLPIALRKPALYRNSITPSVEHRVLKVPPGIMNEGVLDYIALNGKRADVARRQFGKDWYSHIHAQFRTKNPVGQVFTVDKFSLASAALLAHFTDEIVAASKNFYILKTGELDKDKFYAAWLNSAIFLLLFLYHRREIGGSFGRLQIVDYLSIPLFVDYQPDSEYLVSILEAFDQLRVFDLSPIEKQMELPQRRQLDRSFLHYIGFSADESEDVLLKLYRVIKSSLGALKVRDSGSKRK
ncbi:MAG: N-6 DNA methylase [Candidatus Odinarchaeota archaeon]